MKQKVKLLMIALLIGNAASVYSQEDDGKVVIEITKDVNGEKKTFKGEYKSMEDMKADPNYQEFAGKEDGVDFWFDGDLDKIGMKLHLDHLKGMTKSFKILDDDQDNFIFKHFGEEGDHGKFFFKHLDGDSAEGFFNLHLDDLDMEEYNAKMKELGIELNVLLDKFSDTDSEHRIKIITMKKVKITDVSGEEFGKKGTVSESNKLVLDDLTFSPNPSSNGKFKVRFKVPEEKELNIRVYNLDGKEVFNRYFERFGGSYSETIDLSGQSEGIYLLEITQDGKRLIKKIAIN